MKIKAILSDFDGTLCPTTSIDHYNDDSDKSNLIPMDIKEALIKISQEIPICIISSKDFYFLLDKVKEFSNVLSCILGMETLFVDNKDANTENKNTGNSFLDNDQQVDRLNQTIFDKKYSIISRHLLIDHDTLLTNSSILNEIASFFEIKYPLITIEKKFLTVKEGLLGGITIDWRKDNDWNRNRKIYESLVKKSLFNISKRQNYPYLTKDQIYYNLQKFFVQKYATHPFVDLYSVKTSKGDAYDYITSEIVNTGNNLGQIIYFGDSENDNPAFSKADVSIGISSDDRLKPDLKCKYNLKFENLSLFLKRLITNDFVFSESLLQF
jgi:hydroxymethylpyrimidine pyrophosphatase-like HAD family hydrolase